jgi:acetyl-CoA carboxylase biotin carboxylase subunit
VPQRSKKKSHPERRQDHRRAFQKVLIANRGEIAVRVAKALRESGMQSVAIYSDVDREALHVARADEAWPLHGNSSLDTYLNIEKVLDIARRSGAQAIHPGYGFLSESAEFARACEQAGIILIGPSAESIEGMGDKIQARKVAKASGVPLVPGSDGGVADLAEALQVAEEIGYPIMLKATAGGGGKGMRRLHNADELRAQYQQTADEARNAFNNDELFVEKFIVNPRHIEIQVFGDAHGNYASLGERECTIQRRHQKVIEEAPSPLVTEKMRQEMGDIAVALARSVQYLGAGTIEFVTDQEGNYYFLEMNTRLQVEHPVTELITGLDLVREQLRVAAGLPLSFLDRLPLQPNGWAIECRIYAEDPVNGFLPSLGRIVSLSLPYGPGVRNDFGIYQGYDVPLYYDPLLGKLAVWGETRTAAILRMKRALSDLVIEGLRSNHAFHSWVMDQPAFREGNLDTGFIERYFEPEMIAPQEDEIPQFLVAAAIRAYQSDRKPKLPHTQDNSIWSLSGRNHEGNV